MSELYDNREEGRRYSLRSGRTNKAGNGPPAFAILRMKKLSTMGQIAASAQHTFRERDTPNADDERTPENEILIGPDSAHEICQAWTDRAPDKVRSNAVRAVEYLVTASPEAMRGMERKEQDAYFSKSLRYLQDKHGEENILSAVIHRDETTPHLSVMVIPIDSRGKLNARRFFGGREKLSMLQTDFADQVGRKFGLERGVENSRAKHKTIRQFYAEIDGVERKAIKEMPKPPRYLVDKSTLGKLTGAKEPIDDFEKRVHAEWENHFTPLIAKAQRAEQATVQLGQASQREAELRKEVERLQKVESTFKGLVQDPATKAAMLDYIERRKAEPKRDAEVPKPKFDKGGPSL